MNVSKLLTFLTIYWTIPQAASDRASHFLNANSFPKWDEGSKLTGEACNKDLLRPCRFPHDFCTGEPTPTCKSKLAQPPQFRSIRKNTNYLGDKPPPESEAIVTNPHQNEVTKDGTVAEALPLQPEAEDPDKDRNEKTTLPPSPAFHGNLFWDGGPDLDKPICLLNHVINEVINGPKPLEEKKKWLKEHANEICDIRKLQVCVEVPKVDSGDADPQYANDKVVDPDELEENGVCRCLESSYVLVDNTCYIPAGLDSKSNCGSPKVYVPVPGQTGGPPRITTTCAPNAECVPSPEYFGNRCRCKVWATLRKDNTCGAHSLRISKILSVLTVVLFQCMTVGLYPSLHLLP